MENLQEKSNEDLRYIIRWVPEQRSAAWEQLLKQSPSNLMLAEILQHNTEDKEFSITVGKRLREQIGFVGEVDEIFEMKRIAERAINQPADFEMEDWHCGTSHCIGGWGCLLNKEAARVEVEHGTFVAASALLPSFVPLFFESKETAHKELIRISQL